MNNRLPLTTFAIAALIALGCSDGTQEQSPGEVLARDSSLASDLKRADTSDFAEAADVAMAFDPDSALPPATSAPASSPPLASSASTSSPAISSGANASSARPPSSSPVPMRVDRSAAASSPPAPPRPTLRPTAPATIHPDPIPTHTLPAVPPRSAPASAPRRAERGAVDILAKVPGAALPAPGIDELCGSPTRTDQRGCLMLHLARSDAGLDRTYQALIADMKREAGTPLRAKEPDSVHQLRVAQRAWLTYRDTECRRRNRGKEGPLWAPVRAQCLGEFSGARQAELAQALRERRGR
jgi:uncharacterized protein YecT (DUF1311 family)